MTDREKAEEALVKAGYVLFHATEEYADYDREDEYCFSNVRVNRKTGNCRINDLIVPADRLTAHLFPALTEEERRALKRAILAYRDDPSPDYDIYAEAKLQQTNDLATLHSLLSRLGGGQT